MLRRSKKLASAFEQKVSTRIRFSTMNLFALCRRAFRPLYEAAQGRSSRWPKVRAEHLAKWPTCAACGGAKDLDVHHVRPYHLAPKLELDPENLLTLCRQSEVLGIDCHRIFGHAGNWASYVKDVRQVCAMVLPSVRQARAT